MSSFNLHIEVLGSAEQGIHLKLKGELDQLTVKDLQLKLDELAADKVPQLIFDLEKLEFMASAGLAIFACYYEIFETNGLGQTLKVINCPENVMRIFQITKMDKLLNVS